MTDHEWARAVEQQQRMLANGFATAMKSQDKAMMRSVACARVVWGLPGSNLVSGDAEGVDGLLRRGRLLAENGVSIEGESLVSGRYGFGFLRHNTGNRLGGVLDEHLTSVCQLTDGLIGRVDTCISDIEMLDRYCAP